MPTAIAAVVLGDAVDDCEPPDAMPGVVLGLCVAVGEGVAATAIAPLSEADDEAVVVALEDALGLGVAVLVLVTLVVALTGAPALNVLVGVAGADGVSDCVGVTDAVRVLLSVPVPLPVDESLAVRVPLLVCDGVGVRVALIDAVGVALGTHITRLIASLSESDT